MANPPEVPRPGWDTLLHYLNRQPSVVFYAT
jgi:hypothetical protein